MYNKMFGALTMADSMTPTKPNMATGALDCPSNMAAARYLEWRHFQITV
jgi:hypothetical protein